jgi:hypothetical protein
MIKLRDIYNEIKVHSPTTKKDILNFWVKHYPHIFANIVASDTLEHLQQIFGPLDEWLDGMGDDMDVKKYVIDYYKYFRPNEIQFIRLYNYMEDFKIITNPGYKIIEIINEEDLFLYCHN